jgi:uncharacterized protein YdhG (YjbR/CyaY superfamily)
VDAPKGQSKSIDEYIDKFPAAVQEKLQTIRQVIRDEAPEAVETISYQMPAFKLNSKMLIYFAAWATHIALYPVTAAMEASIEELPTYRTGKGTLQFPLDQPLPLPLIRRIVAVRVKENQGS